MLRQTRRDRKRRRDAEMTTCCYSLNSYHHHQQEQEITVPQRTHEQPSEDIRRPASSNDWTRYLISLCLLLLTSSPVKGHQRHTSLRRHISSEDDKENSVTVDYYETSNNDLASISTTRVRRTEFFDITTNVSLTTSGFIETGSTLTINSQEAVPPSLQNDDWIFAVVPKTVDNPYFDAVKEGCEYQARMLSLTYNHTILCNFTGANSTLQTTDEEKAAKQTEIVEYLLQDARTVGVSISVQNQSALKPVLEMAALEYPHKPIITFDSDMSNYTHLRKAYIGTNNTFFGKELARAMLQLHPNVGTYAILQSGNTPNMQERTAGFLNELHARQPGWTPVAGSPGDAAGDPIYALDLLDGFANQSAACIVSLMGLPMRKNATNESHIPWRDFYDRHYDKNIQYLSGDAMEHQLELLSQGYVQALIGQLPYEMGTMSVKAMMEFRLAATTTTTITDGSDQANNNQETGGETATTSVSASTSNDDDDGFRGTNVLSHIFIPLEIPQGDLDDNLIGNLRYVGYSLFGVIVATAIFLLHWTINYRNVRVVQVAQPKFLAMVIVGVVIMATCLVPLGKDDGGEPDNLSYREAVWICMSVPWMASIGFTMTFSALYAKTRRINKIFHSNSAFARVKVSESEVLLPFTILLLCNFAVLTTWTYLDPLTYERRLVLGTDGWNRVLETYGVCRSDSVEYYLVPIAILDMGVLILANWQAFEARHIEAEFSETKYIAICMASMLQAAVSGVPVLFVVRDNPQAFYLVLVFMIFIIGMVILLVIFVPKIMFAKLFMTKTEHEQRDFISFIIQKSSRNRNNWGKEPNIQLGPPPGAYGLRPPTDFESRWKASTGPTSEANNSYRTTSQYSQYPTSSQYESTAESSKGPDDVGTGELLVSPNVVPAERMTMGHITEHSSEQEYVSGRSTESRSNSGDSFIVSGSMDREQAGNRDVEDSETGEDSFANYSSHHGGSFRSMFGRKTPKRMSSRSLFGPSSHYGSHHPAEVLGEDDDPRKGMLVYRTLSIRADGSLAPSSVHTRHSRLVFSNDDSDSASASFYTGTPHASSRTLGSFFSGVMSGDSTHGSRPSANIQNRPSGNTTASAGPLFNRNMPPPSSGGRDGPPSAALPGSTHGRAGRSSTRRGPLRTRSHSPTRTQGHRQLGKTLSHGMKPKQPRLPSSLLRAIVERNVEDSEGSERSTELSIMMKRSSHDSSHHTRSNNSGSNLNVIPEIGSGTSDDGESVQTGLDSERCGDSGKDGQSETDSFVSAEMFDSSERSAKDLNGFDASDFLLDNQMHGGDLSHGSASHNDPMVDRKTENGDCTYSEIKESTTRQKHREATRSDSTVRIDNRAKPEISREDDKSQRSIGVESLEGSRSQTVDSSSSKKDTFRESRGCIREVPREDEPEDNLSHKSEGELTEFMSATSKERDEAREQEKSKRTKRLQCVDMTLLAQEEEMVDESKMTKTDRLNDSGAVSFAVDSDSSEADVERAPRKPCFQEAAAGKRDDLFGPA